MKKVDSSELRLLIERVHGKHDMVFKDLFATGCWLHLQGKTKAGRKLVRQVIDSVKSEGKPSYLESIIDNLDGQESELVDSIFAHYEVNALFEDRK